MNILQNWNTTLQNIFHESFLVGAKIDYSQLWDPSNRNSEAEECAIFHRIFKLGFRSYFIILFLLLSVALHAQTTLDQANQTYAQKDYPAALKYYLEAGQKGSAEALYKAATMYEKGEGTKVNMDQAVVYYKQAADRGLEKAKEAHKRLTQKSKNSAVWGAIAKAGPLADQKSKALQPSKTEPQTKPQTLPTNVSTPTTAKVDETTKKAATDQMVRANDFIQKGDFPGALPYLQKAAEMGHMGAMRWLGVLYGAGMAVPKNPQLQFKWILGAAEKGHRVAMSEVGTLYAEGTGTPKNTREAIKWFSKVLKLGGIYAQESYDKLTTKPAAKDEDMTEFKKGLEAYNRRDYSAAIEWYHKAVDKGNAEAAYRLGLMQESGLGFKKSVYEAYSYYVFAAIYENPGALDKIDALFDPDAETKLGLSFAERVSVLRIAADEGLIGNTEKITAESNQLMEATNRLMQHGKEDDLRYDNLDLLRSKGLN